MKAAEKNPAINEAKDFIIYLSGDEQERALADLREKYRMDKYAWEADARQEGLNEGLRASPFKPSSRRRPGSISSAFPYCANTYAMKMDPGLRRDDGLQ